MEILKEVKLLLGVDDSVDDKLNAIINITTNRLNLLAEVDKTPIELEYIIIEVSIIRYNRIGSEGASSHSVEGESLSFNDNDFSGYLNDIETYKDKQNGVKGCVRFL